MTRCFAFELPVLPHTALGYLLAFVEGLRSANLVTRLRHGSRAPRFGWRLVDGQGRPLPPQGGLLGPLQAEGAWGEGHASAWFLAPLHRPDVPAIRDSVAREHALARCLSVALDTTPVSAVAHPAATVNENTPLNTLSDVLQRHKVAVLVDDHQRARHVITMIDVIDFLAA